MGAVSDVLTVALGGGGAAAVLATTLQVWLQQQRSHVRLKIGRADGTHIEVDAHNVKDLEDLVRLVVHGPRVAEEPDAVT